MASTLTKTPALRAVAARSYSSCSSPLPVGGTINYDVRNTVLPNKLVVASADNQSPISRVSIVFRAGPRNETPENSGVAHVIRICAGCATENASQFAIARNIQQVGASLTASSTRETISYTLEGTRSAVEKVLPFLTEVAAKQVFRPWDISDNVPRLRLELSTRPLQFRAVDLLHKAAFRQGLGNSLFISKHQLGKISSETVQHYYRTNFTSARAAVVGLGVAHNELVHYAQSFSFNSGEGVSTPSPYKGGEIRSDKGGDVCYIAIGGEGGSIKNAKEALAFQVLQRALGVGPQVKWGWTDNGVLSKTIGKAVSDQYVASALNANYSDTGLFGVVIASPVKAAGQVVEGVVKTLKGGSIGDGDIERAKNQLKRSLLTKAENGGKEIEKLGVQAAVVGNADSAVKIAEAVDSVNANDVKEALQKVGKKLSIASVGDLRNVPFLDQLK